MASRTSDIRVADELTSPSASPRLDKNSSQIAWLSVIIMICVVLPLVISGITGSLSIPHNDSWAYSKIAQYFGETGRIRLVGWNRSSLMGQVLILGPASTSLVVQHLFVALCGAVCIVAGYLLVRPRVGGSAALLIAAALGAVPEFGLLSTQFMADIPALAGTLVCLWAGDQAIRRSSAAWWWFAVVAGLWAVTIREQALVGLGAVLVAGWWLRRPSRRLVYASGILAVLIVVAFEVWRQSLPGGDPPTGSGALGAYAIRTVIKIPATMGLFLLPVLVAVARPRQWRPLARWLAGGSALLYAAVAVWWQSHGISFLVGNYLIGRSVAYPVASVGAPIPFPAALVVGTSAAAVLGTGLLVGQFVANGIPRGDVLLCTAGALLLVGTVAQTLAGQFMFARALLLMVPVVGGLLLRRSPTTADSPPLRTPAGFAVAAVLAGIGVLLTSATYSYDAARWQAAQRLVVAGARPQDVDAGLEWVGSHSSHPYTWSVHVDGPPGGWYLQHFAGSRACTLISGSPQRSTGTPTTVSYRTFVAAPFGASTLYIYQDRC